MVFLEDVVEPLFKLTRSLYFVLESTATGKDKPTKEDAEKWFELAKRYLFTSFKRCLELTVSFVSERL